MRAGTRDSVAGALLGAAVGTVVLGVGGRIAMRGIALLAGQPPGFSLGGSATVVFLGTLWGTGGGLAFVGLRRLFRRRRHVGGALFWAILVLITLHGLRPVNAQRLLLFVPLVIVYGTTLQLLWCRLHRREVRARRVRSQVN